MPNGPVEDNKSSGDPAPHEADSAEQTPHSRPSAPEAVVAPQIKMRSRTIALVGTCLWAVLLLVVLLVPDLRSGDRAWWPWSAVSGMALGLFGWTYLSRGRGNAADAP